MIVYLRKQSGINCPTLEAGFDFMIKYNIKIAMVSRDQIYQHQRSHLRTILNENVCL